MVVGHMQVVVSIEFHLHANSLFSEFRVATVDEISLFNGISPPQPMVAIIANCDVILCVFQP